VSATYFVDTGEVARTIGFEEYRAFADGAVVIPVTVRAVEYARLNRLVAVDTLMNVSVVAGSGGRGRR
jgi:hypothetical protein